MTETFFTGRGAVVQIGRELGKGGEGSVYELPTNSGQVAKLYHRTPDSRKQDKLRFMAASTDAQLLSYAAWPQETLHKKRNGPVLGFLMPKVTARAPIHMLYSPAHRRQEYPKVAWDFLLFVARNTAAAFATLHMHGHILGDVNQGNIMVGKDSKVVLIDCDSFQINAKSEIHLCEVGVSHFTPPELQGRPSFDGIKRTFNHDNFGLALLIFHILFGGRHPYSGVPLRKDVGEALETDIKAFRFAYTSDAQTRGISPPPNSIPLSLVPESLEAMFHLAFTEGGASRGRPSAQQWNSSLDSLRARLKRCSSTSMHIYPNHLGQCPWCVLENKGVIYFIDFGFTIKSTGSGFVLSKVWTVIDGIPTPPQVALPNIASISVSPRPLPRGVSNRWKVFCLRLLVVAGAIWLLAIAPGAWFLILAGAWLAWAEAGSAGETARNMERTRRSAALDKAIQEYQAVEKRIIKESGPEEFAAKKQELSRLRKEYESLPNTEKSEIDRLHATAEARQKQQFLDRCFIDASNIPGVGLAKKATLRSFGIETAADVNWDSVYSVRGFGEVLTRAVVDWKKSCERRFVFNPRNAVSEADKNAVRVKIASRKHAIEMSLKSGASDLQRFAQEAIAKRNILYPQLNSTAKNLAQAQADLTLIK